MKIFSKRTISGFCDFKATPERSARGAHKYESTPYCVWRLCVVTLITWPKYSFIFTFDMWQNVSEWHGRSVQIWSNLWCGARRWKCRLKASWEELLIFPEMATKLSLDLWKEGGRGVENKVWEWDGSIEMLISPFSVKSEPILSCKAWKIFLKRTVLPFLGGLKRRKKIRTQSVKIPLGCDTLSQKQIFLPQFLLSPYFPWINDHVSRPKSGLISNPAQKLTTSRLWSCYRKSDSEARQARHRKFHIYFVKSFNYPYYGEGKSETDHDDQFLTRLQDCPDSWRGHV